MELNRDQIIKALECCANEWHCGICKYRADCKEIKTASIALIKELTEERDGFQNLALAAIETQNRLSEAIEELTEENANLHASCTELERFRSSLNDECAKVRADTVRKMTEMIKKYFPYYDADSGLYVVLDQIEKRCWREEMREVLFKAKRVDNGELLTAERSHND